MRLQFVGSKFIVLSCVANQICLDWQNVGELEISSHSEWVESLAPKTLDVNSSSRCNLKLHSHHITEKERDNNVDNKHFN